MIDREALHSFAETGFFVRERAIPEATCDALLAALSALIEREAEERIRGTKSDADFWKLLAGSAHRVEVFFDPSGDRTALPAAKWEGRAMRIGHGLHVEDPTFAAIARSPEIAAPLARFTHVAALLAEGAPPEVAARAALESPRPARVVQSAVIYKQPASDAVQFGFHRDSAYLPNDPESLVLAFLALDATTPENGCLEVIPRTHKEPLGMRLRLGPAGFVEVGREGRPAAERGVLLPLPRGSVAFVHGRTMHASAPNRSAGPRRALIVHAMSDLSTLAPDAWVKPPPGGFVAIG